MTWQVKTGYMLMIAVVDKNQQKEGYVAMLENVVADAVFITY